uniref:Putative nucleotide-binding alpha-beta plait domain-containing protein n=1 Tax=Helianthus annuus TaxID=4232 RepID=A0A251V5T1_HELAN
MRLDAQSAINDLNGKWLRSRQIRCNWAANGAVSDDKQRSNTKSVVELTNGTSDDGQEKINEDALENNPQHTTVYVGNLAPERPLVFVHHCPTHKTCIYFGFNKDKRRKECF